MPAGDRQGKARAMYELASSQPTGEMTSFNNLRALGIKESVMALWTHQLD